MAEILAHISDLHLGRDAAGEAAAEALCAELVAAEVDVVVATGDLTHRGRLAIEAEDLAALDAALGAAPTGSLVAVALHHHLLPLPEEHVGERLAALLGWPHAAEVAGGPELVEALRGRCDLVLHGHRHRAAERTLDAAGPRPLRVLNAGATPELGRARLLAHERGRLLAQAWLGSGRDAPRPQATLAAA